MQPLLSVIVTIYNKAPYLRQCVESVLNQTLRDVEIILVDDGSTDGGGKICDEYEKCDNRVRVIHQKNAGRIAARKNGVRQSIGRYIVFVDADDFIDKLSYEYAIPGMEKGIDIISFGYKAHIAEKFVKEVRNKYSVGVYDKEEMKKHVYPTLIWDIANEQYGFIPSCCNNIVKRQLWEYSVSIMRTDAFALGEDPAFVFPMVLLADRVEFRDELWYNYRIREAENGNMAVYYSDAKYFDKLYLWYCYLRSTVDKYPGLLAQLDCFYISLVDARKSLYGIKNTQPEYIFPFDKVNKGDAIVMYGAGVMGQSYMRQIRSLSYCSVVRWVDASCEKYRTLGVAEIDSVREEQFDKIVIAISDVIIKKQVKHNLIAMGIDELKIIL